MTRDEDKTGIEVVCDELTELFTPRGFKRRGRTWSAKLESHIVMVAIAKSPWGPQYYYELSVYLNELRPPGRAIRSLRPKYYEGHLWVRATAFFSNWRTVNEQEIPLSQWLDFDNGLRLDERIEHVRAFTEEHAIPFLEQCMTLEGLKAMYCDDRFMLVSEEEAVAAFFESVS